MGFRIQHPNGVDVIECDTEEELRSVQAALESHAAPPLQVAAEDVQTDDGAADLAAPRARDSFMEMREALALIDFGAHKLTAVVGERGRVGGALQIKEPTIVVEPAVRISVSAGKFSLGAAKMFTRTTKMRCASFSLPAGTPQIGGSCSAAAAAKKHDGKRWVCDGCYATGNNYYYPAVQMSQRVRLEWVRASVAAGTFEGEVSAALKSFMAAPRYHHGSELQLDHRYFRVHDSGDFSGVGVDYLRAWIGVMRRLSSVRFWIPTRDWIFPEYARLMRGASQNAVFRPSALHVDDAPPSLGSTAEPEQRGTTVSYVPDRGVWDCPAARKEVLSCADAAGPNGTGCRACWDRPDLAINYMPHRPLNSMMARRPEVQIPSDFRLRDYQEEDVANIEREFAGGRRCVLFAGTTGQGKTEEVAEFVVRFLAAGASRAVLWLAPTRETTDQAVDTLRRRGVKCAYVLSGEPEDRRQRVQVGTIGSVRRRQLPRADLVIVDEAQHAPARTWRELIRQYPDACWLGVSGSPWRLDGRPLGEFFEVIVRGPKPSWLVERGWISDPLVYTWPLSAVGSLKKHNLLGDIFDHWTELARDMPTVCFARSVEQSRSIVEEFSRRGVRAEHVDGTTGVTDRRLILRRFKEGQTKLVSTVAVLSEGWDAPEARCMISACQIQSLTLWLQQCGRVMRAGPVRPIVLDHGGNALRLKHPASYHEWSLSLSAKKSSRRGAQMRECPNCHLAIDRGLRVCPGCGGSTRREAGGVEIVDGSLVSIDKIPEIESVRRMLEEYADDERASEFIANLRWPSGVSCPSCESEDVSKHGELWSCAVWRCVRCEESFTVTPDSFLDGSYVRLNKWIAAIRLLRSGGVDASQLHVLLGVKKATAKRMQKRIRETVALDAADADIPREAR